MIMRSAEITLHVSDHADLHSEAIDGPRKAVILAQTLIGDLASETVLVIMLDARHRLIGHHRAAQGSFNVARLAPRDVLIPALTANAASVVLAHNHPSGDPHPSSADRTMADLIAAAGQLVGVRMTDWLVVTADPASYFSYTEDQAS